MANGKFKYDIKIQNIDLNVPHGIILSQITPGSFVLECGCATGYMTKYMTQKLGCHVNIIEYSQDAFDIAKHFAEDGICADLMQDEWKKKFNGRLYDHIILADVLEHLYDPSQVLRELVSFLKADGKIHISVPNIAHNDIIINLINNYWNYTPLGLLDNTHIRFWAYNNLEPFFKKANLSMVNFDYSFVQTGVTEQANFAVDVDVINQLHKRMTGNIYQFVVTLQKIEYARKNNITPNIKKIENGQEVSNLYYSSENSFSGDKCISALYVPIDYCKRFILRKFNTSFLRFDPLEQNACIVYSIEVTTDRGEILECFPSNGIRFGKYDLFLTCDPYYYIRSNRQDIQWLDIQMKVIPILDTLEKTCFYQIIEELKRVKNEYGEVDNAYKAVLQDREDLIEQAKTHTAQYQELDKAYHAVLQDRTVLIEQKDNLTQVNDQLRTELIEQKDNLTQENERLSSELAKVIQQGVELDNKNKNLIEREEKLREQYDEIKKRYDEICSSLLWRMTKPIRKIIKRLRKR